MQVPEIETKELYVELLYSLRTCLKMPPLGLDCVAGDLLLPRKIRAPQLQPLLRGYSEDVDCGLQEAQVPNPRSKRKHFAEKVWTINEQQPTDVSR
jgi:hypothetical protein